MISPLTWEVWKMAWLAGKQTHFYKKQAKKATRKYLRNHRVKEALVPCNTLHIKTGSYIHRLKCFIWEFNLPDGVRFTFRTCLGNGTVTTTSSTSKQTEKPQVNANNMHQYNVCIRIISLLYETLKSEELLHQCTFSVD